MTMFPSACVWHSRIRIDDTLRQVKQTAFHYVDVDAAALEVSGMLQVQKELGLQVSCVALDRGRRGDKEPDYTDSRGAARTLESLRRALVKAAEAGARLAHVRPCGSRNAEKPFAETVLHLAGAAAASGIRLCVENVPGTALPGAREVLAFLERLNHANVFFLLDAGHAILTKEDPSEVIARAGNRLGYIQLNDNDGRKDRHWPLRDGVLTEGAIRSILDALQGAGYEGTLGLELAGDQAGIISGLAKNRNLLLRMQVPGEPKSLKEPEARRKA